MRPGKRNRTGYLVRKAITGKGPLCQWKHIIVWVDLSQSIAVNFRRKGA